MHHHGVKRGALGQHSGEVRRRPPTVVGVEPHAVVAHGLDRDEHALLVQAAENGAVLVSGNF